FQRLGGRRERPHLIVSAIEHASVLETCAFLERTFGCEVTRLTPDAEGLVSAAAVARALRPSTVVVTVMMVNNEVGTLQPVREIAALLQGHDAHFHVDAVQAVGKMPVNAHELGVHSLSFSGHKFHAPKGIGGLYLRSDVEITPLLHGGGQENGLRGGTEAVAMAAAMGAAARSAHAGMAEQVAHAVLLARTLRGRLYDTVPGIHFHGPEDETRRIANT